MRALTTRDRAMIEARCLDHTDTYGAPKGSISAGAMWVAFTLLCVIAAAALVNRWDTISEDVAHCSYVLRVSGASDSAEAIRCNTVVNG